MRCCILLGMIAVFAVLIIAPGTPGLGQQPKDPLTPAEKEALLKKLATPGEHHQRLDALAGKWKLAVKWRNGPDDKWA